MASRRLMLQSLSTDRWQHVLQDLATDLDLAAAMINVVDDHELIVGAVFDARQCFRAGDRISLAVNSYCAQVLRSAVGMFICDVRSLPALMVCNPTAAVGFVHYFGEPIFDIDGRLIGTICVMDTRAHARADYAGRIHLLREARNAIQSELHDALLQERADAGAGAQMQDTCLDVERTSTRALHTTSYNRPPLGTPGSAMGSNPMTNGDRA